MSTSTEIVVVSPTLGPASSFLGQLAAWHPRVDVLVDPLGQKSLAGRALFQLCAAATVEGPWAPYLAGTLGTGDYPTRVLSSGLAKGAPPALFGYLPGTVAAGPVNVAIIGWDPLETFDPLQVSLNNANVIPSGSGPTTGVSFGTVPWRPTADVMTQASNDPLSMNLIYQLWAVTNTVPNIRALVGAQQVGNQNSGECLIHYEGGANTLELDVYCPGVAPAAPAFGALLAQAPGGIPGGGPVISNVRVVTANDTILPTDYYLSVEPAVFPAPLTLLITAGLPQGQTFVIKDSLGFFTGGANVLTIQPQGGETIDLAAELVITSPNPAGGVPGRAVTITKVGTNWEVN